MKHVLQTACIMRLVDAEVLISLHPLVRKSELSETIFVITCRLKFWR